MLKLGKKNWLIITITSYSVNGGSNCRRCGSKHSASRIVHSPGDS
jgi:hypothetical protein